MFGEIPSAWNWETVPAWDGSPRAFAVGVAQSDGLTNCFYLFSGRNVQKNMDPEILYDAHVYNPSTKKWSVINNGDKKDFPVMAGTAFPVGASSIVFSSGANGELINKQLEIEKRIKELKNKQANGVDVENKLKEVQVEL